MFRTPESASIGAADTVMPVPIFAVSAVALVGFVYWNTARVLDRETEMTE